MSKSHIDKMLSARVRADRAAIQFVMAHVRDGTLTADHLTTAGGVMRVPVAAVVAQTVAYYTRSARVRGALRRIGITH